MFEAAVIEASQHLRAGKVVALPTETVYGLAANAWDRRAVAGIFETKGRPSHNPLIVHVADWTMLHSCVTHWSESAERLARAFWPGPLTLVVKKSDLIPLIVTANGDSVAIRWPSHPFIQAVIQACGFPLAAPSANLASAVSPTTAAHVQAGLGNKIDLIVDGGACSIGIESTVVDMIGNQPRILRPGMIHAEEINQAYGCLRTEISQPQKDSDQPLRSPGLLEKHYSPRAKMVLWKWENEQDLRQRLAEVHWSESDAHIVAYRHVPERGHFRGISVLPENPEAYARALYAELHACDESRVPLIILELPPMGLAWEGIHDRLRRAVA